MYEHTHTPLQNKWCRQQPSCTTACLSEGISFFLCSINSYFWLQHIRTHKQPSPALPQLLLSCSNIWIFRWVVAMYAQSTLILGLHIFILFSCEYPLISMTIGANMDWACSLHSSHSAGWQQLFPPLRHGWGHPGTGHIREWTCALVGGGEFTR